MFPRFSFLIALLSSASPSWFHKLPNDYDENYYSLSGYRVNNLPCSRYFDCNKEKRVNPPFRPYTQGQSFLSFFRHGT